MNRYGFEINGIYWKIRIVRPDSIFLIDKTKKLRFGTTDRRTKTVYLSSDLHGGLFKKVLLHEIGHCILLSYDFISDIEKSIEEPYRSYFQESFCSLYSEYGIEVIHDIKNIFMKGI